MTASNYKAALAANLSPSWESQSFCEFEEEMWKKAWRHNRKLPGEREALEIDVTVPSEGLDEAFWPVWTIQLIGRAGVTKAIYSLIETAIVLVLRASPNGNIDPLAVAEIEAFILQAFADAGDTVSQHHRGLLFAHTPGLSDRIEEKTRRAGATARPVRRPQSGRRK